MTLPWEPELKIFFGRLLRKENFMNLPRTDLLGIMKVLGVITV